MTYAINPWMRPDVAVDVERALAQWDALRRTYLDLGHRVDLLDPVPGLPDMVYAANGATVVDGMVYGARFRYAERGPEAAAHRDWFRAAGYARVVDPEFVNEGEGDLLVAGGVILAGSGFRTDPRAHAEAARVFGREVVPLELVDPRFYHLDTALAVLDATTIAWLPEAFSPASRAVLRRPLPGRRDRHGRRRRRARPQRRERRPPRRAARRGHRPRGRARRARLRPRPRRRCPSC